jgi:hypothetical protein
MGEYTGYLPTNIVGVGRHEGIGLPMSMADGHVELVLKEDIKWTATPAYWQPAHTPMASFSQYNYYAGTFGWDSN